MTEIDKAEVHSGRKPIPKRKRFEVFKRDGFQCVYCGAKPPGVALHVDHVEPVVKGGTNETSNLVTACPGCNLGKGAIKLTENGVAALKTRQLAYQREIAEVDEAYNDWVGERRRIYKARVNECSAYWAEETGVAGGWDITAGDFSILGVQVSTEAEALLLALEFAPGFEP